MKTLSNYSILLLSMLLVYISGCSKDDEKSVTYNKICGEWEVTDIQFSVSIGGENLVDFLINSYGLTEEEAQAAFDENENAYRDSWTGTMEFKEDGTYEFYVGGENHSSYWFLGEDVKTIHVYFDGYYIEFDIVSINENTMKLRFDQIYYIDLNSDGSKEAIAYLNDFTLEK